MRSKAFRRFQFYKKKKKAQELAKIWKKRRSVRKNPKWAHYIIDKCIKSQDSIKNPFKNKIGKKKLLEKKFEIEVREQLDIAA